MTQISKLLSDEVVLLAQSGLKRLGNIGVIAGRLQIILAAKQHGITDVCRIHGISRTTLTDWIRRLKNGTVDDLRNKPKKPQSPLTMHETTIKEWIENNPNITAKELIIKIREELGITIGQTAVRRVIKKLNFSYITPRPQHHKQDKTLHEEFKKKSSTDSQKQS